jgi:peptide-methionine (S)-S-oxide reductase
MDHGNEPTHVATFGGGCFWGVEESFRTLPGVIKTAVGFMGGPNPITYQESHTDSTGHAEVVHLKYSPEKISYEELLRKFFSLHDPTQVNRQGPDIGTQYRSIIFYHSGEQKRLAEEMKKNCKIPVNTARRPSPQKLLPPKSSILQMNTISSIYKSKI